MHHQARPSYTRRQQDDLLPLGRSLEAAPGKRLYSYAGKIKGVELVLPDDQRIINCNDEKKYQSRKPTVAVERRPPSAVEVTNQQVADLGVFVESVAHQWLSKYFSLTEKTGVMYSRYLPGLGGRGGYVPELFVLDALSVREGIPEIAFEIKSTKLLDRKYKARKQLMEGAEVLAVPWPSVRAAVVFVDMRKNPSVPHENFISRDDGKIALNVEALTRRINRLPVPVVHLSLAEISQIAHEQGTPLPEHLVKATGVPLESMPFPPIPALATLIPAE